MNMSLDGALIHGPVESHIGARVQVSIRVPSNASPTVSVIDAYIVRKSGPTFAIQWAQFAPAQLCFLAKQVRSSSGQLPFPREVPVLSASSTMSAV